MQNLKPVDVAIVGGGWTGLMMAKEITTRTGLTVTVLERGGPRKTADYAHDMDELDYAVRLRMMQNIADETITHRHSTRASAVPVRQYGSFLPGTGVGGAGEHWNGAAWRFLPTLFTLRSHLNERHGAAKLPQDLAVQDWGVTYDDLEPHYWRAEQLMGVGGKAGNLNGKIIDGGNPFEGPRRQEYPLPPLKNSHLSVLFESGAKKLGYRPHTAPAANLSETYKNPDGVTRPGCAYCGYCERFGCMIGAKSQPSNTLLPILQRRKNFELRTGCWVRRIVHKDGKATGVQYIDSHGNEMFQPASIVVLATFTLNNTRLLYLSKIGTPYDAAAGKGTLGKNLTHQVDGNVRVFLGQPLNAFMGTGALAMRISEFDGDHGLNGSEGLLRMGMIGVLSNGNRPIDSFDASPTGSANINWGSAWKTAALKWRDRNAVIALSGEHLSYRQNFMDLDPTYTDKFGDPLLRFTLDWTDHEYRQSEYAREIGLKLAAAMGAVQAEPLGGRAPYNVVGYQSTHIQGGTVMGLSAESSVVNRYQQHWDMQNLWVLGASCMPQNASHNPTLTILATTTWAADALIDRYLKHPGSLA